jgi:hypothetical protein
MVTSPPEDPPPESSVLQDDKPNAPRIKTVDPAKIFFALVWFAFIGSTFSLH